MNNIVISIKNLSAGYNNHVVLENISLNIRKGQHWIFTGSNGSGKTTLARSIAGKTRKTHGTIAFPFFNVQHSFDLPKGSIGFASFNDRSHFFNNINHERYYQQRFNAFDSENDFTLHHYLSHFKYDPNNHIHSSLIALFEMNDLLDREMIKLSSGQQRKALLIKSLLSKPKILILDNPYIGLDPESRNHLNILLDRLVQDHNITILLFGHFTDLPRCICSEYNLDKKKEISINSKVTTRNEVFNDRSSTLAEISYRFAHKKQKQLPESIIKMSNVSVQYDGIDLLKNLGLHIKKGEKHLIKGNNGSGKSTLISLVFGDNPQAYAHNVHILGQKRGSGESIWDIKKSFGFISPELHHHYRSNESAEQVIYTGLFDVFEIKGQIPTSAKELCKHFITYFKVDYINQSYHTLSTGQQRLILFLRSLIKIPPCLLLDEPFQGLDIDTMLRCKKLLETALTPDQTLLFISHFDHEVPCVIDQVLNL